MACLLFGKLQRLGLPRALVFHADVCKLAEVARAFAVFVRHAADEHAEAWFEGGYRGGLGVAEERIGHVVDHLGYVRRYVKRKNREGGRKWGGKYHAAISLLDALLRALRDALVRAITRFEVECCGPVVA